MVVMVSYGFNVVMIVVSFCMVGILKFVVFVVFLIGFLWGVKVVFNVIICFVVFLLMKRKLF